MAGRRTRNFSRNGNQTSSHLLLSLSGNCWVIRWHLLKSKVCLPTMVCLHPQRIWWQSHLLSRLWSKKKSFFFLFLPLHPKSHGDKQQTTRVMNTRRPLLWHECCSPFFVDWLVLRQSLSLSLNDCVLLQPVITKLLSLWLNNSVLVVLLLSPPFWFPCTVCSLVCCCHSLCYAVFVGVCRCPFTRCMLIN